MLMDVPAVRVVNFPPDALPIIRLLELEPVERIVILSTFVPFLVTGTCTARYLSDESTLPAPPKLSA